MNNKKSTEIPARNQLALAIGGLFLAPGVAFAACPSAITTISTALTESQCYDNDESVTVTSTGSVKVTDTSLSTAAIRMSTSPYLGTFTNSGAVSNTITATGYAETYGVQLSSLAGSITNSSTGTISATANLGFAGGSAQAYVYGVTLWGDLQAGAMLTNAGSISVRAVVNDNSTSGVGYGIYASTIYGAIANSGSITVVTEFTGTNASSTNANAYGVHMGNIDTTGSFANTGTISSRSVATDISSTAYAYGVYGSVIDGMFSNSGVITAMGASYGSGYGSSNAYGAHFDNIGLTGSFTNAGTISGRSDVNVGQFGYANAYGVYVGNSLDGRISNSGTISATAVANGTSYGSGSGYGLYINTVGATGSVMNTGTIAASATSSVADGSSISNASAYALQISNSLAGSLTNTGTMSATATATQAGANIAGANAYGIYANQVDSTGTLTNSGSVSVMSTATNPAGSGGYAYAYGTYTNNNMDGVFSNSGSISATATAVDNAYAYGTYIGGTLTGTLTNSGTIRASAQAASGEAYGVYANSIDGTLNNSGTISAMGTGGIDQNSVYSIYSNGGSGTVNNQVGGLLDGRVMLNGSVNLNNAGTIDTRLQASSVGGNYTQAVTGVLRIGAMSNTSFGTLNVGGTANLAAGTGVLVTGGAGNTLTGGTLSSVVTSSGLTMSSATVTDNLLAVNYQAVANGNNVDLVGTSTGLTSVAGTVPGSMSSVGGVLDALLADIANQPPELQAYLYSLAGQTTAQGVTDKVSQIQPMIVNGTTQTGLGASRGVNTVVLARIEGNLGRSAGDKFYGDRKVWLKPFGSWADQDARDGVAGYKAQTAGMVGGVDADVGDYRLGLAFGYARSDVDGKTSTTQTARVNSYQFTGYGSRNLSPDTEVNFIAGFGLHDNSTRRVIDLGGGASAQANSESGSTSANVGAGIARAMKWGSTSTFTPSLRADYTWISNNGYIESGAGALGLNVSKNDVAAFIVAASGKYVNEISERQKFSANLGLGYDLINERGTVVSAFSGAPTAAFSTQGIKLEPWLVRGGMGYTYRTDQGAELTARYDLDLRSGFTNQTVSFNARWAF